MNLLAHGSDCSDFLYWLYNGGTELEKQPQEEQMG
jgi:uncharacterized membrane protein YukC